MKIMYLTRNDGTDHRATKMCNSLSRLGHKVIFVGWDRSPDKSKSLNLVPEVQLRILKRAGKHAQNSFQGWGDYYSHVVRALRQERPDAVQAVNEEKALLVLPFKGIYFKWLVLDIFDSVIANSHKTKLLDHAAKVCRAVGNRAADRIIETGSELQAMLGKHAAKSIIIENAPPDPGEVFSKQFPTTDAVRLAIGGTINRKRLALDKLLAAVDALPKGAVEIEASGWLFDDYSKEVFVKHPAVHYQWLESSKEFLRVAATCDALLYIRGDADECPYRAAVLPNRIFDCISIGRPIIVNRQMSLAKWVEDEKLGYVVPDVSPDHLVEVIGRIRTDRARLPETARRLREVFLRGHTWEVMESRLGALYVMLASN